MTQSKRSRDESRARRNRTSETRRASSVTTLNSFRADRRWKQEMTYDPRNSTPEERQARLKRRIEQKKTLAPRLPRSFTPPQSRDHLLDHELNEPSFASSGFEILKNLLKVCLYSVLAVAIVAYAINSLCELYREAQSFDRTR